LPVDPRRSRLDDPPPLPLMKMKKRYWHFCG
jgi:hypothetical protein